MTSNTGESAETRSQHESTDHPTVRASLARELPWLIALGVAVCGLTVYLLTIGTTGAEIANVLALPAAIVGVVVTVVSYRLGRRMEKADNDPGRDRSVEGQQARRATGGITTRRPMLLVAGTTVLVSVIVSASIVVIPRMISDQPVHTSGDTNAPVAGSAASARTVLAQYLSGTVHVGINGTLPGWSLSSSSEHARGFDVDLVEFLKNKYHFTPKYVQLRPREREDALKTGRVKLVVANYSMTSDRDKMVDFAGPYFRDRSGILCSEQKIRCDQPIQQSSICVTNGTVASGTLPGAQHRESIVDCTSAFYDSSNKSIGAISTDLAILEAYGHSVGSVSTVAWANERDHPISEEYYGIGLPDDSPQLCRALSDDINEFLTSRAGWDAAYRNNLSGFDSFGRKPNGSDRGWCGSSP